MKRLLRIILIVIAVLAIGGAWAWYELSTKPANERIQAGVRKLLKTEPRLRPLYEEAMKDGVLTTGEAMKITRRANELKSQR